MVEVINQIGHVIGLKTVAEFVGNEEIIKRFKDMCNIIKNLLTIDLI
jgi:hypothetical protein